MKKTIILILGLVLIGFASCEYKFIEPDKGEPVDPEVPISFSEQIEPIWSTQNCTACHDGNPFSLLPGEAYQSLTTRSLINLESPEDSEILTKPEGGHGDGYVSNQSELIKVWIEQGAKDN
ncbi:hypothetical protein [Carboxylicivirga linearis]|uniref:Cytochrome c domain-containing protein n=1 Tax=Carboxylicivirga linearis TaxID=1628157 RepID=A0ABS5JYC0_9BACT|nr:hypothetical protein [Carboxylicivirga linearis]MBS2099903.1 hypothetical protein [Carboxylicivirga linearis]